MEPGPRSFNSLDCFSYTSISIYDLLFLPMAPKTCCGKTQPFSLSCPQTLEVYSINPILPLVTQFRAQYDITNTCTL